MYLRLLLSVGLVACVSACSATGPKRFVAGHDPMLDKNGGVTVMADVCIQRDALTDPDYYVMEESKAGAQALIENARKYLNENGVAVRATVVPFVCGARVDNNATQKVAERVDGAIGDDTPPFAVADAIKDDIEYIEALTTVSTYAFVSVVAPQGKAGDPKGQLLLPANVPGSIRNALAVISKRTNGSNLLYLGVRGYSQSAGKATALLLGRFAVGMATGAATAGRVMYIPGQKVDGRRMIAGTLDLEAGQLAWANTLQLGGDPIKADVVANPNAVKTLLFDLVQRPDSAGDESK